MAHGQNAEAKGHAGREYHSRRLGDMPVRSTYNKRLTHRRERAAARRLEYLLQHSWEHEYEEGLVDL